MKECPNKKVEKKKLLENSNLHRNTSVLEHFWTTLILSENIFMVLDGSVPFSASPSTHTSIWCNIIAAVLQGLIFNITRTFAAHTSNWCNTIELTHIWLPNPQDLYLFIIKPCSQLSNISWTNPPCCTLSFICSAIIWIAYCSKYILKILTNIFELIAGT